MTRKKYYIVYPYKMCAQVVVPSPWGSFPAALTGLLKELTGAKYLGSEIKWIVNYDHRKSLIEDHNVTSEDLDDYLKSNCHIFTFTNKLHRKKAIKELLKIKASNFISVDTYRDVLLNQANYARNETFLIPSIPNKTTTH